ncbi:helix-turn-helix domain-containing protein [Paenibacillus sp. GYB004]|uniref:helix-turn-helix domain-containing protein n=1 Tax=Paenibacillus sp. GYB004 TaxID=2994393 RepID=UPI002F963342
MMLHVLIVEPGVRRRAKLSRQVRESGHLVIGEASCGEEALTFMERQGWPTVLLADLMPPGLDGLALVRRVYEQRIPMITIVQSDSRRAEYIRQAMQAGAIDFLLKPVKEEQLRLALSNAERRMHYYYAAHRELNRIQSFFEQMDMLRQDEFIRRHADLLRGLADYEEAQRGERLGLFRMLYAKWHTVLSRRGQSVPEPPVWQNEEEAAAYFRKLGDSWMSGNAPAREGAIRLNIRIACEYIREHYRDGLTLTELSERFGMSVSYFSVQMKRYTGESFVQFLNRIRVEKAKDLLLQPGLKVYEAAEQSGFETLQYFNKVFRRFAGMTPGEYRRQHGI